MRMFLYTIIVGSTNYRAYNKFTQKGGQCGADQTCLEGQGRVLSHAHMYTVVSHIFSHSSTQLYSSIGLHYPDYYCALNSGVQITFHT